ncbi:hypothetical protein GINT2_000747 [Glugoides intestinalis]
MENLETLMKTNQHEKILLLPSPEYNRYKVIAAIQLEKYTEALLYSTKNTFEQAYILYKLKKFKKALKVLRKLKGTAVEILASQCLYFMGYYIKAYKVLSKHGISDEFAVNLSAIKALSQSNGIKPTPFTTKDMKPVEVEEEYKFTDAECAHESEYNSLFKYLSNQKEFLKRLRESNSIDDGLVQKQLSNLLDENIDSLSKKEKEINDFNRKSANIEEPVLFQHNFIEKNKSSDYQIYKDYQRSKDDFLSGKITFEPYNDRLRLLKALIIAKRGPTEERSMAILKTLEGMKESTIEKDILKLLSEDIPVYQFQKEAIALLHRAVSEK